MAASLHAQLIGIDWGTSSLRAYRLAPGGAVLESRQRPWGILHLVDRDFDRALSETLSDWVSPQSPLPIIASGMIGSRGGWREVPYAACPADPGSLAAGVCVIESSLGPLHLVPGVIQNGTEPNVMRGEETQILGALASDRALAREALLVLPGTHCKWVVVQAGLIQRFATHMTGELFALLRDHSLLGRPAQDAPHHASDADEAAHAAFLRGIRTARDAGPEGLSGRLFTTRSLFLTGELAAPHTLDYLSGLLIGEEIRSALAAPGVPSKGPVLLVGNPALCARYHLSLGEFGIHHAQSLEDTAPCGLWKIAEAYGLVPRLAQP